MIRLIGHASIQIYTGQQGFDLITDPWLFGTAFNGTWALTTPPASVDWSEIKYIWLGHEHSDHMHVETLRSIPLIDKKRICILYQKHSSPRVANYLTHLGFNVLELPIYEWMDLNPETKIYCGSVGTMDSFLVVRRNGKTILNLNDCVLTPRQLQYIKNEIGDIDWLFTQFSVANYEHNRDGADEKIRQLKKQQWILKPTFLAPFASYAYFCDTDNARMNELGNTATDVFWKVPHCVFLYPGDTIPLPPQHNNLEVARRYESDRQSQIKSIKQQHGNKVVFRKRYKMLEHRYQYMMSHPWGPSTTMIGATFEDLKPGKKHDWWFRWQNIKATEVFNLSWRCVEFFWRKRWEIVYRFLNQRP